ncbi:MAG: hypothetical protein A2177_03180 [Spirochaetes bacterium RBG_13_68_11]|nr:MAG: hypothetical protein A2177_03180 [Spirochaetes bacterium RBG_13_68_11]
MRSLRISVPTDFSDVTEEVPEKDSLPAPARRARLRLIHVGLDCQRPGGMEFEFAERAWIVLVVPASRDGDRRQSLR